MLLAALLYVFQVNFCHLTNIVLPCQLSNSDKNKPNNIHGRYM